MLGGLLKSPFTYIKQLADTPFSSIKLIILLGVMDTLALSLQVQIVGSAFISSYLLTCEHMEAV